MNPWSLTDRQCQVLSALANGSTKAASSELGCSPKTVEVHVREAKLKMRVRTRIQAVVAYDRHARSNGNGGV